MTVRPSVHNHIDLTTEMERPNRRGLQQSMRIAGPVFNVHGTWTNRLNQIQLFLNYQSKSPRKQKKSKRMDRLDCLMDRHSGKLMSICQKAK